MGRLFNLHNVINIICLSLPGSGFRTPWVFQGIWTFQNVPLKNVGFLKPYKVWVIVITTKNAGNVSSHEFV